MRSFSNGVHCGGVSAILVIHQLNARLATVLNVLVRYTNYHFNS